MVKREYRNKSNDKYRGKWSKPDKSRSYTGFNRNKYQHDKRIKCYNCNKFGHIAKNCRTERKFRSVNLARISEEKNDSDEEHVNVIVLMAGPNKLLMSEGRVNGNETERILFDTGSTASIMSMQYALKNNIKYIPHNMSVRLANNSISKVNGITESPIEINVGGRIDKIKFLILKNKEFDILLGMD